MPKLINLNNSQLNALKHDGKNQSTPTQYPVNTANRLYAFCYASGKNEKKYFGIKSYFISS